MQQVVHLAGNLVRWCVVKIVRTEMEQNFFRLLDEIAGLQNVNGLRYGVHCEFLYFDTICKDSLVDIFSVRVHKQNNIAIK